MGNYGSEDSKSVNLNHNCMIGSKGLTNLMMFFVHNYLGLSWNWNKSPVDNEGVSSRRSVAVGVNDRWNVTCDMLHVTFDM